MMTDPTRQGGADAEPAAVPFGDALELLTVDDVARRLKIGRSTVYLLCRNNDLPHVTINRSVRIPLDRLEQWLRARTRA
jgi:excisionase family DNA binding protein